MSRHSFLIASYISYQDGRVVKALDLRSNGRIVRVGSNPTPGNIFLFFFSNNRHHFFIYISFLFSPLLDQSFEKKYC